MKKALRKPNFRQKAVIDRVTENVRKGIPIKSKGEILRAAGYAPSTVDHPDHVFDQPTVASALSSVIGKMEERRNRILEIGITDEKIAKASGMANAMSLDILTKNIELLSGRPTERSQEISTDEEILERILEREGSTIRATERVTRRRKK